MTFDPLHPRRSVRELLLAALLAVPIGAAGAGCGGGAAPAGSAAGAGGDRTGDAVQEDGLARGASDVTTRADGVGPTGGDDITVLPDAAPTLSGRLVHPDGEPVIGLMTLACGDYDCRYAPTDGNGFFRHEDLDLEPRRFEVLGQVDKHGSVVFRREFPAGVQVDVGEIVLPTLSGAKAAWDPEEGGVAELLDGALTLQAAPGTVKYFPGTLEFAVQAAPVAAEHIPPYYDRIWSGLEDVVIAISLAPFDVLTTEPVQLRLTDDRLAGSGTVYEMFDVDPLVGTLESAGTATVDDDGWLVSDPDSDLRDLTFMLFLPLDG